MSQLHVHVDCTRPDQRKLARKRRPPRALPGFNRRASATSRTPVPLGSGTERSAGPPSVHPRGRQGHELIRMKEEAAEARCLMRSSVVVGAIRGTNAKDSLSQALTKSPPARGWPGGWVRACIRCALVCACACACVCVHGCALVRACLCVHVRVYVHVYTGMGAWTCT